MNEKVVEKIIRNDLEIMNHKLREMMVLCEINVDEEVIKKSTIVIDFDYIQIYITEIRDILNSVPVLVWHLNRVDDEIYLMDAYKADYLSNPVFKD